MNVLSDCLSMAREKRVMVLDQIQNDSAENRATAYQLVARKQVTMWWPGNVDQGHFHRRTYARFMRSEVLSVLM